jgi:hypothetical protein
MSNPIDFHYTFDGMFYRVVPNTPAAISTWNASPDIQVGMLAHEWKSFKRQARAAGYSVAKAKPVSKAALDKIFAELDL